MIARLFGLGDSPRIFEFKCADCGEIHRGSPSFGYDRPPQFFDVPEDERAARIRLTDDTCVIHPTEDEQTNQPDYYIRGILEIPIHGVKDPFLWGLWVTQSKESFERYIDTYGVDQAADGSFGWLPVAIPYYKRTAPGDFLENLKCNVIWRGRMHGRGQRPLIEAQACDHPLYIDQRDGISWERAVEIARRAMHG